ncbi:hypothetical protein [Tessaracoccus sp. OH4464_COT-324]|uniref:hypothetical protein n=1 Tax=Tessaracoccus sp. OH4464_COT-324 TaxID=2491059 RepID=UPI000F630E51|nr:hypothetical protein [Tessaracoccus sp. OH4464_COT-324]RRD46570.1 hypothetical protein EII42_05995 [Tessaracoccus sp. OH4464_COT-324]
MSPVDRIDDAPTTVRWFAVVSLCGHLLLLGSAAYALWVIAGRGWVGAGAAAALVVAYVLLWRFWLAPGSRQRLGVRERLGLKLILVPLLAVFTALGEVPVLGVVAASFIFLGDYLNERS